MMNVYNGNVRTDRRGVATVRLPRYFEALNRDFRYQLTALGVAPGARRWSYGAELRGNAFVIRSTAAREGVVAGDRHPQGPRMRTRTASRRSRSSPSPSGAATCIRSSTASRRR